MATAMPGVELLACLFDHRIDAGQARGIGRLGGSRDGRGFNGGGRHHGHAHACRQQWQAIP
jgi:hypothetical protein